MERLELGDVVYLNSDLESKYPMTVNMLDEEGNVSCLMATEDGLLPCSVDYLSPKMFRK